MPKGRPSYTGKPKLYVLRVRLDDNERTRIEARAAQLKKAPSTHARDLLLADAGLVAKKSASKRDQK